MRITHNIERLTKQLQDTIVDAEIIQAARLKAEDEVERLRNASDLDGELISNLTDEIERLRAHIAKLEEWQQEGQKLFDNYAVGLGAMFGLGKWWGERPWGKQ